MLAIVTPDTFLADPTKAVIAVASPDVPAVACIIVPAVIPPPMAMTVAPILPSITPSEASSAMAVTMPDELGIPMDCAYWDMAAIAIP